MFRTSCAYLYLGSSMLCVWGLACFMFRTCACCLFSLGVFFWRGTCSWFILGIRHALWLPVYTLHLGPVRALCSKPVYTLYVWDLRLLEDLGVLASWLGPPVHTLLRLGRVHALYIWESLCFASRFRTCACFLVDTPCACFMFKTRTYCMVGTPCVCFKSWNLCLLHSWDPPCLL